jgi:hypothetical protein
MSKENNLKDIWLIKELLRGGRIGEKTKHEHGFIQRAN